jgi:hypothetical protein
VNTELEDSRTAVRWGWVTGCFAGGGALVGLAFLVEARWHWQGVSTSVLVQLGASLGLAGVLFLLERRFTRRVERASERAAKHAAEQVETRMQERTDRLAARLDELQSDVMKRVRRRAEEQDATIAALRDDVSYETVTTALTEANRLNAIHDGQVTVQASYNPDGLILTFSWVEDTDINSERSSGPHLDVDGAGVNVEWRPGEPGGEVGHRLVEELQRAGRWDGETTLDWGVTLRNLQASLDLAISSIRRDRYAWHLHGPLIELVSPTWVLTTAGVEHLGRGLMVPEADFPEQIPRVIANSSPTARQRAEEARTWCPEAPNAVDPAEWERVISHGRSVFPRRRTIVTALGPSTWVPWGSSPDHAATPPQQLSTP